MSLGGASVIITGSHFDDNDTNGISIDAEDAEVTVISTSVNRNSSIRFYMPYQTTKLTLLMVEVIDNSGDGLFLIDGVATKQIRNSRFCGNGEEDIRKIFSTGESVSSLLGRVICDDTNLSGGCDCTY